jgi:hypothetical protein
VWEVVEHADEALFDFCLWVDSNSHADPLVKFLHTIFTNRQTLQNKTPANHRHKYHVT